jgi:putative lipoic acid-binding regulatory protein
MLTDNLWLPKSSRMIDTISLRIIISNTLRKGAWGNAVSDATQVRKFLFDYRADSQEIIGVSQTPDKPVIEYPCIWSYKIICLGGSSANDIVKSVAGDREFTIEPSRSSTSGKFESHDVSIVVMSDDDRVSIFHDLKRNPSVRYVL